MEEQNEKYRYCNCWFCGGKMNWNAGFSFEDYGIEGDGIVAVLVCTDCGAEAEFYTAIGKEEDCEVEPNL